MYVIRENIDPGQVAKKYKNGTINWWRCVFSISLVVIL